MAPMMCSLRLCRRRLLRTDSINGRMIETWANRILFRSVTFLRTCPARRISIITAHGAKTVTTVLSGIRRKSRPTGLLIATAIGATSALGAGPGWTMRLGALLHFTMDAGVTSATDGAGILVPALAPAFMVLRSSVSSAEASASDLAEALASDGSRLALV